MKPTPQVVSILLRTMRPTVAVAHAHVDELRAYLLVDRAVRRMAAVGSLIAGVERPELEARGGAWRRRRAIRARIALREATDNLTAARKRHSLWYATYTTVRAQQRIN